ncbi:pentapeptide repeat-containing protein [Mycolicibacterium sp. 3033]|nr:pentapeptide repeat-containing protein [Mycolicibacterium aurantiacum]
MAEALRAADLRAVDLRGVDLRGVDLRGVDFWGVDFWGVVTARAVPDSAPPDRWLIWCRTSAVPPTASSSGHSTSPAAPMAPRVSAAAPDE